MTTDDAARAEAWADYAQTAHLRARPEAARDRSALVQRFFLCRTKIVSLLTDMDECFQAAAPAPAEARSLETIARVLFFAAWNTMPDVVHPSFEHDQELWMEAARAAADALAPARHVAEPVGDRVEAACRELHEWWDNPNVPDSMRAQPRKDVSRALAAAGALAPAPAVPDEVRRACEDYRAVRDHSMDYNLIVRLRTEYLTVVDTWIGSLLAAPAQPAEDAERIARIERYREALSKLNRRIRELEGSLQALSGKKGPSVLEMMIAERDRRIHELERERDDLERDLKKERHDTDFLIENLKAADITIEPAQGGIYIRNAAEGILRQTEREVAIWASVLRDQATEIERLRQRCAELEQNHE